MNEAPPASILHATRTRRLSLHNPIPFMGKLCAFLLVLLIPTAALAQEGTVRYEQTVRIEIDLPPEMAHMRDQIPDSRTDAKLLVFNASASLMKDAPQEESDVDAASGSMRFRMMGRRADDATYTDFDAGSVIEKRDFMDRTFLITDEATALPWRLTGEQSEFLGYLCQKATTMRDSVAVEAWFTPQIPVPAGPASYNGLPGLILVLTEDDGRRSFVAKEVTLEPLAADALVTPTEGRKVSRDEFDAVVEEKMKEMNAQRRGSGGFIIRM